MHNKRVWSAWKAQSPRSVILVDFYAVHETLISYSYFVNVLARKHDAGIRSFAPGAANGDLRRLYASFNTEDHVRTTLDRGQRLRAQKIYADVRGGLKTKEDVFNLEILGLGIGTEIYESYLRGGRPTVQMDDPKLWDLVQEGIGLTVFWHDYFRDRPVAAVVVSHDCYLYPGLVCKVAYRAGVPVYLPNARGITYAAAPHSTYSYFPRYREMFARLPQDEKREAMALAERQLDRRLAGELNVDMPYQQMSAFRASNSEPRVLTESDSIKVLICSHCFYDNPHGYGGMLFVDFYEWLRYLAQTARQTDYEWYLKTHPDLLPGTLETIHGIFADGVPITVLSPETSHRQLVAEGIQYVLTAYGTVGGEYAALGLPVINAGYNPRVAYDFNWHPQSVREYEELLLNLPRLKKEISVEEVYESYFMHHYYTLADDLVFPSYRQMLAELNMAERLGPAVYDYFLEGLTEDKHREIIRRMGEFIESGRSHLFSRGPE